jgi:hypothetical protein
VKFEQRVKKVGGEAREPCHPLVFFPSSVRKRLKNKEIANPLDPNARKRIEAKDLGYFVVGRGVGR